MLRIGMGYDVHAFAPNRKLRLGGVDVPYEFGLDGHSDADVLIHALCDAILGAAAMRDIGYHFPDTAGNEYEGIDSTLLLSRVMAMVREAGYKLVNCDCTVMAQAPKLMAYIPAMQNRLAEVMGVATGQVSVKATTTEHLGFVGRKEGIAAQAVAMLEKGN